MIMATEDKSTRLKKLYNRKTDILAKMKSLRLHPEIHNAELKRNILNDELNRITARIMELKGNA